MVTKRLCEFLGITPAELSRLPAQLIAKLIREAEQDEWMKVHHLGYAVHIKQEG